MIFMYSVVRQAVAQQQTSYCIIARKKTTELNNMFICSTNCRICRFPVLRILQLKC